MGERQVKVVLIGARGYARAAESLRVDCFVWAELSKLQNIRDYDMVILNLLPLKSEESRNEVDWDAFVRLLGFGSAMDILMNAGMIVVLGDPRFTIDVKAQELKAKKDQKPKQAFLAWTGVQFVWDPEPGDTVAFQDDYDHRRYADYVAKLNKWTYSLATCRLDEEVVASRFNLNHIREQSCEIHLHEDAFCYNRYKHALAVGLYYQYRERRHEQVHQSFGPVVLLPEISLSEDETLQLVLTTICGIETNLPEPEWLKEFIAPGQKSIDNEITRIHSEIQNVFDKLAHGEKEREECRKCLKLLYEREFALEPGVGP